MREDIMDIFLPMRSHKQTLRVHLKRGYSIEVGRELTEWQNEIVILGNYSKSEYNATPICSIYGIAPTVRENHGQVTAICVMKK